MISVQTFEMFFNPHACPLAFGQCVCVCVCVCAAGECVGRFTNQKTPYCVRFNPDEDKQNFFLVGCADKKIYCVS